MSPADQAELHVALLKTLRAKGDLGLPEERLLDAVRMAGHELSLPALRTELRALADRGWVSEMPQPIGTTRHRITAVGRSILEEQRL